MSSGASAAGGLQAGGGEATWKNAIRPATIRPNTRTKSGAPRGFAESSYESIHWRSSAVPTLLIGFDVQVWPLSHEAASVTFASVSPVP